MKSWEALQKKAQRKNAGTAHTVDGALGKGYWVASVKEMKPKPKISTSWPTAFCMFGTKSELDSVAARVTKDIAGICHCNTEVIWRKARFDSQESAETYANQIGINWKKVETK